MMETTIAQLVAWIESRGNFGAIRFEPETYNRLNGTPTLAALAILSRIQKIHMCSYGTAKMIYATSWGEYQLMGFNIYSDPEFKIPVSQFLGSGGAQRARFDAFLARNSLDNVTPKMLANSKHLRLEFSIKYNGAIAYEQPMISALVHFGLAVAN